MRSILPHIDLHRALRQATAIGRGQRVTMEYRKWCSLQGYTWAEGVYKERHPKPFPLKNPMECDACGHVADAETIQNGYSYHRTIYLATWDEPGAEQIICAVCQAEDPFQAAITCAECFDYPCTCTPEDYTN